MSQSPLFVDLMTRLRLPERLANGDQLRIDLADPSSELCQTAQQLLASAPAAERQRFLSELEEAFKTHKPISEEELDATAESVSPADQLMALRAIMLPKMEATVGQQLTLDEGEHNFEEMKREFVDRLKVGQRFEGPEGQVEVDADDVKLLSDVFNSMSPEDIKPDVMLDKLFNAASRKVGIGDDVLAQLDVTSIKRDDLTRVAADPQALFQLTNLSQAQFNGGQGPPLFNDPASDRLLAGNYRQAAHLLSKSTPSVRGQILATFTPAGETQRASVLLHDCAVHDMIKGWSDDELQAYLLLRMEHQSIAPDAETFRRVREEIRHGRNDDVKVTINAFLRWFYDSGAASSTKSAVGLDQDDYDEIKQRFALRADQDTNFTPAELKQFVDEMAQRKLGKHFTQEQIDAAAQLGEQQFEQRLLERFSRNPELVKELGLDGPEATLAKINALFNDDNITQLLGKLDTIPAHEVDRFQEMTQTMLRADHATDGLIQGITNGPDTQTDVVQEIIAQRHSQ